MPELAEVDYYRRRWDPGLGRKVLWVSLHPHVRDFRDEDPEEMKGLLTGAQLRSSEARGKQILFRFSRGISLGIHLGMTGKLRVERAVKDGATAAGVHDHLVLHQSTRSLVFSDPRQFGRVRCARGPDAPVWWADLAPSVLSDEFTPEVVARFCDRHRRAPLEAVLLRQERFPGIGNWMAD